jgi:acetone carboxylase gamma subunit
MKIKSITKEMYFAVEMEDGEFIDYRTYGNGEIWEVAMGESWEPVYGEEEPKLHQMFQDFIKHNEIKV